MFVIRWFKQIMLAVLSLGSGLVIAACYGVYYMEQVVASGVASFQGQGTPNMEVCAWRLGSDDLLRCDTTDESGFYEILLEDWEFDYAWSDGIELSLEDVDGEEHLMLQAEGVQFPPETVPVEHDFELEEVVETP